MSDLPEETGGEPEDDIDLGEIEGADDGEEAGEGEAEGEGQEADAETQPEEPPRRSRRGEVARWRDRAERSEQQFAELSRQLQDLQRQRAQPVYDPAAAERAQREKYERWSQLAPADLAFEVQRELEGSLNQRLLQAELRGFDRADVAEFNQLRSRDRAAERLAPQVEQLLAQRRQAGDFTLGRLDIYDFLRGRELRTNAGRAATRQRVQGQQRLDRATTRPARANGDIARTTPGRRGDQDAADEAMLRNIRTSDI